MQTFATPAPVTAIVDIPAGRMQFTAADRADTTVEIRPATPAKGRDVKLAEQITTECNDGILRIAAPSGYRILGSSGAVELTVRLPAGSRVEAKAASAQFTTMGQLGDVTFESSQATIKVDQAATANLSTVDGDISVGRLGGDAKLCTVRGDIQVAQAAQGTVEARSETGAITIAAAAGVSATLDAGTTMGRIHNALKNAGGTAGLAITATSTLGDITASSI